MQTWISFAVLILLFLAGAPVASANTVSLSFNLSYTGHFSFYCGPYVSSFEINKHYIVTSPNCTYSIPSTSGGNKVIALYKGTPGNATFIGGDIVVGSATLIQQYPNSFINPQTDDTFFATISENNSPEEGTAFQNYFEHGDPLPAGEVENQSYYVLPWKWGPKPASEYDPVVIIPGILGSWQKNGEWILDPITHTYDNLLDTLRANGYVDGQTLFPFGYDWENSNIVTAHLLANKIAAVKQTCRCNKVDIVAHSMGGLVAEQYIESDEYRNDADQLILLAVPQTGAPFAYLTWEGGVLDFGTIPRNILMQTKFHLEALRNGYSSIFDYIRDRPVVSIQELLPVFSDYLRTSTNIFPYPTGYPGNFFLESLVNHSDKVFLNGIQTKVLSANNLLSDTPSGFIVASSTQTGKWEHGQPTSIIFGKGDGTVPEDSALFITGPDKEFTGETHLTIASSSSTFIFKTLNNVVPDTIVGKSYSSLRSFLYFKLFSPIDMQIIAPDGKRLGKDFTNNSELNEIPNAFYSGFNTDDEYAVVVNPLPGQYKINIIGTGTGGHYEIAVDYADTSTTAESLLDGTTTASQIITNTLFVSGTSTTITLTQDTPPAPALSPDTCITDMTKAYQNKWITKKLVYDSLVFDCKTLKTLFAARDKSSGLIRTGILALIKLTLDSMDLLAKDKTNTQDAVVLIHSYTTWFRTHELQ